MVPSYKRLLQLSVVLFTFTISIAWLIFPICFKHNLKKHINLSPECNIRAMWQSFPFPFDFGIHVFNVTNPEDIQNGHKPIVEDLGPFVFDEFKDKYDVRDDEDTDSVSFNMRNTYSFRIDKSNGLTGEELITMPHPLIQMMAISVQRQSAEMIKVIAEGLNIVFKNTGPFITAPFLDLFFRGFPIDCSHEHFAAKAVCDQFGSGNIKGIQQFNETHFTFSLLGQSNHSDIGRYKVLRGRKNSRDIGKVIKFNRQTHLNVWSGDECNKFKGTDGTIFSPYMDLKHGLWSYSPELCRSMGARYRRSVHYEGLPAARFIMDFGDMENEKENACFCRSYPDNCPVKGTMDLSPCSKSPMIASMPHFLHGDDSLLENVDGLSPEHNMHGTHIDIETMTGTALSAYKRIQFNLDMEPVAEVDGMKHFRKLVMPMFWIDECFNLIPAGTEKMALMFELLFLNELIKWIGLVLSLVGFAYVTFLYNRVRIRHVIRPVT